MAFMSERMFFECDRCRALGCARFLGAAPNVLIAAAFRFLRIRAGIETGVYKTAARTGMTQDCSVMQFNH